MKKINVKNANEYLLFLIPFGVATVLRLLLGYLIGAWFPGNEYWDDALLARYSEIIGYFRFPTTEAMIKYLGYSVFLCIVGVSQIPMTIWLSALWLIAGYLTYNVSRRLRLPKWISFIFFIYMAYMPEAFEAWCGTRLYRNSIIGPFVAISLLLMIKLFFVIYDGGSVRSGRVLLWSVVTGLTVTFTYYIKEDGIWLLACLCFAMILWVIGLIHTVKTEGSFHVRRNIIIILIPLFVLVFTSVAYKSIDYKFFGVYGTNTRTSGSSGEFMSIIYTIDSPNRNAELWAPYDAIKSAFDASKTLSDNPELLRCIENSSWLVGGIFQSPIYGDFLGWVIYDAGIQSGTWTSNAEKENFFKQVNKELKEAFENGTLKKAEGRITLLPSAGSRTIPEVLNLKYEVAAAYRGGN